ncbi:acyl-CoA synthetase [Ostreibacterium oceani]|uniref:AMP-binding protein n=1 Tax=Ostreibacterium oceani TaxID=2654998 RepID=A0A6N7EWQ7_9GAMM|nr:acyl-CoA synthetase [Ostreibacterium oceani]MPV85980.1 AMP-binding protein [Ostreibacterium oceani]
MTSMFDTDLDKNLANYTELSPLTFIERAASVYPEHTAVVYGNVRRNWREIYQRCIQLASALQQIGIGKNDAVAVLLPNIPEMLECHFAIPMAGGVINALNIRLDASTLAFMIEHSESKLVIVDREYLPVIQQALNTLSLDKASVTPQIIVVDDAQFTYPSATNDFPHEATAYETLLDSGNPQFAWTLPDDEWNAIALGYTSGTTGLPKGVVTHHRGAYLNAVSNVMAWNMNAHPVYLWTLPMFHCNGWCFPWTIAALNGTHVCLRSVKVDTIFRLIAEEKVTHLCGAPIILSMMSNADAALKSTFNHKINVMTAASAPPPSILEAMANMNIHVTHTYGLTEVYGPAVVCAWHQQWDQLAITEQAELKARQGVRYPMLERLMVAEMDSLDSQPVPVPNDGQTIGEILFRGNVVMKGYLKNPAETQKAFASGWFHSGDLAVCHPDGYVEIRDRDKDIIISGGENISSIEIEKALYKHPAVAEVAVVAKKDDKWGEVPCAFISIKPDHELSEESVQKHCRANLAGFKIPKKVIFGELSKTATGKIQKNVLRDIANKD